MASIWKGSLSFGLVNIPVDQKGGEKPYALLREASRNTNVVGVGEIVMRNTQHLVGVRAMGDALVLEINRFANELVDSDDFHFPRASEVRPQELHMAEQLVHNLAAAPGGTARMFSG